MKPFNTQSLTNDEILEHQLAIKKIISLDLLRFEKIKNQSLTLRLNICKLREQYAELSKELHIRTKGITKIKPHKPRKRKPMSETAKRIRRLVKEVGSEEIKRQLAKI